MQLIKKTKQNIVDDYTRNAYDKAALKYFDLFNSELVMKEYDVQILKRFCDYLNKGDRVLDAGCGPTTQVGDYLLSKDIEMHGVDISPKCIELARQKNKRMQFQTCALSKMPYDDSSFNAIVAYYSIIHTPKQFLHRIFKEFRRVLINQGYLLVVVKAGDFEGFVSEIIEIPAKIYFKLFSIQEVAELFEKHDFEVVYMKQRSPYQFELQYDRIYVLGKLKHKHS